MILELGTTPVVPQIRKWLRGVDLNHRPLGYEPNELPDCSTPRSHHSNVFVARSNFWGLLSGWVNQYILRILSSFLFRMSLRTLNDVFFAVVERQHPTVMLERLGGRICSDFFGGAAPPGGGRGERIAEAGYRSR